MHTALSASHTASGRQDFETETFIVEAAPELVATLDASFGKLQGASGQDLNHGHSHLVPTVSPNERGGGGAVTAPEVARTLRARHNVSLDDTYIAHALTAEGFDASEDGTGRGTPIVVTPPRVFSVMPMNSGKDYKAREVDVAQPLMAAGPVGGAQGGDYVVAPVAFNPDAGGKQTSIGFDPESETTGSLVVGQTPAIAFSLRGRKGGAMPEVEDSDLYPGLPAADGGSTRPFVAFSEAQITSRSNPQPGDPCHTLPANTAPPTLANDMAVRRITVVEAERLMGFRDGYTLIEWPTANRKGEDLEETVAYLIGHGYTPEDAAVLAQTPDGPRYKALGNSKGVPVVRSIGKRYAAALTRYLAKQADA